MTTLDPLKDSAAIRRYFGDFDRVPASLGRMYFRDLLMINSIKEKIRALQKTKALRAEDVLGEETFARSLTLEDLKYLFAEG